MARLEALPTSERDSPRAPHPVPRYLALRVVLLVALLVVFSSWSQRHLGTAIPGLVLVGIGLLSKVFDFLGGSEKESHKRSLRGVTLFLLGDGFLSGFTLATLICCAFISSVTVMAAGEPVFASVRLAPEGDALDPAGGKTLAGSDDVARFLTLTTPMGRPLYLEVAGFQRHSFDLFPWSGKVVRVARDLRRSPAILLRIHQDDLALLGRAVVELQVGEAEPVNVTTVRDRGALALGREIFAPTSFREEWRGELKALNFPESAAEARVRLWRDPLPVADLSELAPGTKVRARLLNADGEAISQVRFLVNDAEIQDVKIAKEGAR